MIRFLKWSWRRYPDAYLTLATVASLTLTVGIVVWAGGLAT